MVHRAKLRRTWDLWQCLVNVHYFFLFLFFHRYELNYTIFDLRPWYTEPSYVGRGTFGNVWFLIDDDHFYIQPTRQEMSIDRWAIDILEKSRRAYDTVREAEVAVKKLSSPFQDGETARKTFRELRLLQILEHENVIELHDLYTPDSHPGELQNIYIVTVHAGWDLRQVLGSAELSDKHERFIIYQLLRGLKYLHSAGIVHRDLKPGNLCLSAETDLTILDLGLARAVSTELMTEYVVTRHYRAPELVCWSAPYHPKADMWSVGCILGELFRKGQPLFRGDSGHHQFKLITEVCGSPDARFLEKVEHFASKDTRVFIETNISPQERKDLATIFPDAPSDGVAFLEKILVLDPEDRMGVEEALRHPYVAEHHDEEDEPVIVGGPIDLGDESPSVANLPAWKEKIWTEIVGYQAQERMGKLGIRNSVTTASTSNTTDSSFPSTD